MDWFATQLLSVMPGHSEVFFTSLLLTGGNMQQQLWREVKLKESTSTQSKHGYLSTKSFFCYTKWVDWKWVTSVKYNFWRVWIGPLWKRRNKNRKWFECIWLLLCPFCAEWVVSIPCLPPVSPAKARVNMITRWFLAHTQNREEWVGAGSWLAWGDIQ